MPTFPNPIATEPNRPLSARPRRHPLGLPAGSVRSVLSIAIVGSVIAEAVRGHAIDPRLSETLTLILGQYFATRRAVRLSRQVEQRLAAEGLLEAQPHPLFLPRFSIRAAIVLSFVGLAVYLYREHRLWTSAAMSTVGIVFAFFLGVFVHWVLEKWARHGEPGFFAERLEDIKAVLALAAGLAVGAYYLTDRPPPLPEGARRSAMDGMMAVVLFYFGSR